MRRTLTLLTSIRLVSINDVYELHNLPRLATFLSTLSPPPQAVIIAGDFISPSTLSSIDSGRGIVTTLRAAGITHACLGNHEADVKLSILNERIKDLSKCVKVLNTNMRPAHNRTVFNVDQTAPHDVITSPCGTFTAALLGLMSDEPTMFRDGTFKGVPITSVLEAYAAAHEQGIADVVVPVTHQSLARDRDLAKHMCACGVADGVVIGGHEHDLIHETVDSTGVVQIVKTGFDANHCSIIDLTPTTTTVSFVDLTTYAAAPAVQAVAHKQLSVIAAMENEVVVDELMVPAQTTLNSERTRFQQTSVGAFFCSAVKDEMEDCDVCLINGASIKGGNVYENNRMTYAQLKKELPFPTKIIVAELTLQEIYEAIHYSRNCDVKDMEKGVQPQRRGYLQVSRAVYVTRIHAAIRFVRVRMAAAFDQPCPPCSLCVCAPRSHCVCGGCVCVQVNFSFMQDFPDYDGGVVPAHLDPGTLLSVALPRNLMAGFCEIAPLIDAGKRLKSLGTFPNADDFIPALLLVTRHCCLEKWMQISQITTFDLIDSNHDGVLDRDEIKTMMTRILGHEPADFVVDNMLESIDTDGDGVIDHQEFDVLLAKAHDLKSKRGHRDV